MLQSLKIIGVVVIKTKLKKIKTLVIKSHLVNWCVDVSDYTTLAVSIPPGHRQVTPFYNYLNHSSYLVE